VFRFFLILLRLGYSYGMPTMKYTPAEASALTNLPIRTVRRLIDRRLIRPRRLQTGRSVQRLLSWEQLVYLRLEAEGLGLLPVAERRKIARQIEADAGIDVVSLSEGSALLIQVKTVRKELDERLKKLERAESVIVEDPETMRGTPIYRGTRIPVELIADTLNQGASIDEILEGYPALDREKVELAPLYVRAFPRRGRPSARPWAKRKPVRTTRHRRNMATPT
jgi:uncharacterized protein (DUF433 family)